MVVGAAGFLGSHVVDKLLDKNIQVIGVDNFSDGFRSNLEEAIKNKNFHLIDTDAKNLDLDLNRLDYLFLAASPGWDMDQILQLFKKSNCRCVFISWIDLYDREIPAEREWFKENEVGLARFAKEHNLNARILRLGAVFGPRMDFKTKDPLVSLIVASLKDELQKNVNLEFSSRALYVDDAADLMIKCILAGATAQKIFDGVSPTPVKVAEIKQILLDPVWFDTRGFTPDQLPPWPTPNLDKTLKFLHWKPKVSLVEALRKTLEFFKDNEVRLPKVEEEIAWQQKKWREEKEAELKAIAPKKPEPEVKKTPRLRLNLPKLKMKPGKIYLLIALGLIFYSLIWPIISLSWGVLTFRYQLTEAVNLLSEGDFNQSLKRIEQAEDGVLQSQAIFESLSVLRNINFLADLFEAGDNLSKIASLSVSSAKSTVLGIEFLYQGLEAVTGERADSPKSYFDEAYANLSRAEEDLSLAEALFKDENFSSSVPVILRGRVKSLEQKLITYRSLVEKGRSSVSILPEVVGSEAENPSKSYLVLLQNNMELRPGGGFIGSIGTITFEAGKLKKLEVNDVYTVDGQLKVHVEPPKEIAEDLAQTGWFLRDSNWEPDFPTSARQASWFYNQETGQKVLGVIALDVTAMENLLSVLGPIDLPDYGEQVTYENLFEKAISHSEQGFFPGSQAKKTFLTTLTGGVLNKVFFLPHPNWPAIVGALGQSLAGKHMAIYLEDPKLFSYVVSQRWASLMPRPAQPQIGQLSDFLFPVEANLGANKANYYLDRSYNLETVIGKDGEVAHRLRINYLNRSPSNAFPAGRYRNRMRVYLPFGTKMVRVLWGETDITKEVSSFVDFGRVGYSLTLELQPKEQKILVLDYNLGEKLNFQQNQTTYRLDVIKQMGTLKDPFEWKITYPINYQIVSSTTSSVSPQERVIKTDLSEDRSFEVVFKK